MIISANEIKSGNILVFEGQLCQVLGLPEHTKPGKGGAYVQVTMKNVKTGTKFNHRFSSSDKTEKAHLEQKTMQYLYTEDKFLVIMDPETFDQIHVESALLEERLPFLADGMEISVEFHQESPIAIKLPTTVVLEIAETQPVIKGATVTSSYKPAILTNGVKVMIPSYISIGEKIVVKTEDSSYVERAK